MSGFEHYLAIEGLGGPRFHPEKNSIAFVYNAPGLFQIYTTNVEKNKTLWPSRMTFSSERCTSARYLSDNTLVFVSDFGGDENFQIGLIDNSGTQHIIESDTKAKHNVNLTSDSYLYFSANIENKGKFRSYRHAIPLLENEPELIHTPVEGLIAVGLVSEDDKTIIFVNAFGSTHRDLVMKNMETGEIKQLTSHHSPSVWTPVRYLDDDTILVMTNFGSDFHRPGILKLNGTFIPYTNVDEMNVEFGPYTFKPHSSFTYCTTNEEGYSELYKVRFTTDAAVIEKINLPQKGVIASGDQRSFSSAMSLNHDETLLATFLSTPSTPPAIYVIDLSDQTSWKAAQASHPGLTEANFLGSSLNRFKSFDDLSVPYFKHIPEINMPKNGFPAIFIIHGGPEAQAKPGFSFLSQFFISAGFAIIIPNIRGSAGYGRRYMDLDNGPKRLDSIKDIKHLALHLKDDITIDTDNLIVYGGSYGGYAVLAAMTEHPELWKGGVNLYGISDFVTFLENTADWRRKLRESEYGSLDDREMLRSISPIHKIDKISSPLFIIGGEKDERVPISESKQIYDLLIKKGLPAKFISFENEGHGITNLENKLIAYPAVLDWLIKLVG